MENRDWLGNSKSSETSDGESQSFRSISSHSDDQETIKASPDNNTQSSDASSKASADSKDVKDDIKSLTEKLSAALANVSAKEDLVKQHSQVAEEAIAGWEKAENEVVVLKQKLEDAVQQNLTLEDRVSHLDGALKECVKQLRQAREEQEQKIVEAVAKTTRDWETTKFELESRLLEFENKPESVNFSPDLRHKIEALEKENSTLKLELSLYLEEMEFRTIERDISTQAAETASKQHLDSVKKVAMLEAECRRLKARGCQSCSVNTKKAASASPFVESLKDDESETWASALIAELDQFKNEKIINRNVPSSSVEVDLMDDFLEMERLATLPETKSENQCLESKATVKQSIDGDNLLKEELETMIHRTLELEEKLEKLEVEKVELEIALAKSQESLEASELQLRVTEKKLSELRTELCTTHEAKHHLESQLGTLETDAKTMSARIDSLEAEIEKERTLSDQVSVNTNESKQLLESQLINSKAEAQMMSAKIHLLEVELSELRIELCSKDEAKQHLESQLSTLETDAETMSAKIDSLEAEIEKERTLSQQVSVNANETKQLLESQLISIKADAQIMSAKIDLLETELAELQEELCMTNEAKQHLESQLSTLEIDAETMSTKIGSLEAEIEKERNLSEQVLVNANESKQLLESQLISIEEEARMMFAKIDSLETEVEKERALSSQIAVKCQELEEELSRKQQEAELQQTVNSNFEPKIKQEDLVVAAGKLAECQKTIASLGQQLKSLATLEDFLIDTTSIPEFSLIPKDGGGEPWKVHSNETYYRKRDPESPRASAACHGQSINKDGNTPPSSSIVSSKHGSLEKNRNGFAKFLVRSKNGIQLEI
ncbi:Filament-like plant protein [Hibiscus syriacus]|uniref:Filament-like plant protein n=1 Tax=Hibiscus syriacus TaxID=106335 RepID=A0A6A2W881_HIBSY|nr:Filament-like plant protein [Hibiscus syriacus]